jgi:hypothetical protein
MRKLFLLIAVLFIVGKVYAEPTPDGSLPVDLGTTVTEEPSAVQLTNLNPPAVLDKMPPLKNVAFYSLNDHNWSYAGMFDVLNYHGLKLDAGYSPSDTVIVALSYDLFNLEKFGVEVPVVKELGLEPVIGYGLGRIDLQDTTDAKENILIGFNIINIRFW